MSVGETVYVALRRRLTSGHYDPGTQLKEVAVAEDLGVSRTPVRAAFSRLIAEGLLTPSPTRGAIVTQWRKSEALDVFNLRILLEGYGAFLAAQKRSDDQLSVLQNSTDRMEMALIRQGPNHLAELDSANREFHEMLYFASGSAYLRISGRNLLDFPMVMGGFYIYDRVDIEQSIRGHREITKGIELRNGEWARAAVVCHLNAAIERFKRSDGKTEWEQGMPDPTREG